MSRRKAILFTFVFLALISFCMAVLVDHYFSQHSPTEPRPEEGKTYRVHANKASVYLTKQEVVAFYLPVCSFFVWFAALAYFGVRWKLMKVPARQPEFMVPNTQKKKKPYDG